MYLRASPRWERLAPVLEPILGARAQGVSSAPGTWEGRTVSRALTMRGSTEAPPWRGWVNLRSPHAHWEPPDFGAAAFLVQPGSGMECRERSELSHAPVGQALLGGGRPAAGSPGTVAE